MSSAKFVSAAFAKTPNTIATRYYHTDVVGSVRAITDETGAVVIRHDYRPFGEDMQPLSGDPNRFAGKQLDAETAMHYFDARYYRQTWGRFSTVDPLQVEAAMTDPQQWNRYAYARNNPLKFGDPTGEFAIAIVWISSNPGTASLLAGGVAAGVGAFWGGIKSFFGFGGGPKEPNPRNKPGRPSTGKAGPRTSAPSPGPPPGGPAGPGADPPDECTVNCGGPPDPPPGPTPPGPTPPPSPTFECDPFCQVLREAGERASPMAEWQTYAYLTGTSAVGGLAGGTATAAYRAGGYLYVRSYIIRFAIHPADHFFHFLGNRAHLQVNWWRSGVAKSGGVRRVPIPDAVRRGWRWFTNFTDH